MRKRVVFIVISMLLMGVFLPQLTAFAEHEKLPVTSLDQLAQPGIRIAVGLNTPAEASLKQDYPEAELIPYSDIFLAYLDVANGRVDACVNARREMEFAIGHGFTGVHLLDENYATNKIAVGISPASAIPDLQNKLNAFIAEKKADGTLDDMYDRWVTRGEETMPDIPRAENAAFTLRVGTTGTVMPYSYYIGTELAGYDIELAYRFAGWLGAELELKTYDFGGIVPAAEAGSIDCIMSNLFYTEEKEEAIPFSDVLFEVEITAMVRDEGQTVPAGTIRWQDYNGKRLGVLTGPPMEDAAAEYFPDSEYLILNSYPDCIAALLAGKIDAYLADEPSMKSLHAEQPEIDYIHDRITENNYSFAFRKNDPESAALCGELNAFLEKCRTDGTMQELDDIWFGVDEERKTVDMSGLTGENGKIRVVTTSTDMPFSYIKDGKNVGYDIDLVVRFCRDRGYALELGDVDFAARIPAVVSGKYDFSTDMNVTPERQEQVLFSEPTSKGGIVLAVLSDKLAAADAKQGAVQPEYTQFSDLKGKTVSMLIGAPFEELVRNKAPDVGEVTFFNNMPDMVLALQSGKTDAVLNNNATAALAVNRNPGLTLFPQDLQSGTIGFAFAKGDPRRDEWQEAFDAIPERQIQAAWDKWTGADESSKVLPGQDWPGTNGTLRVAACDTMEPMSYVGGDGELKGFDLEVILMMAKELDVHVEFTGMEFAAVLASVQAGKADIGTGSILITAERAAAVDFVEYHSATFVLIVRERQTEAGAGRPVTSFSDLENGRIGAATGSVQVLQVEERFPNADIYYFSTDMDMLSALRAHKIDAFADAEVLIRYMMTENEDLTYLDERLGEGMQAGAVFPQTDRGQALCDEFSTFIREIRQNGVYDEIMDVWFGKDEGKRVVPDLYDLPATKGILRMAADTSIVPFAYIKDGKAVGVEIDIVVRFCEAYGYGLEVVPMDFTGIIPSVVTGKVDFACSGISYTPERAESVLYSEPTYYESGSVMAVLKAEETAAAVTGTEGDSFWTGVRSSFEKTFIRESRWRLFVDGVLTTLLITLLTILFGTLLGFGVFMLCRNGNIIANSVTRFSIWLVQGMPMVVLLMILYYVILGSVVVSGIAVAVIGFTLTFGSAVFGLLKLGVGAVDIGQYEAAYALGYSNRRTFLRIILPQVLPHVLPSYKGEIVGLIKATAIVGYIAVQDLTKMGDIVRSRTYEAFFPLIAITIIYFVLEGLLGFFVSRIHIRIDPRKRKRETILKGVNMHD